MKDHSCIMISESLKVIQWLQVHRTEIEMSHIMEKDYTFWNGKTEVGKSK